MSGHLRATADDFKAASAAAEAFLTERICGIRGDLSFHITGVTMSNEYDDLLNVHGYVRHPIGTAYALTPFKLRYLVEDAKITSMKGSFDIADALLVIDNNGRVVVVRNYGHEA